jgi:uncharacterized protein DUF4397
MAMSSKDSSSPLAARSELARMGTFRVIAVAGLAAMLALTGCRKIINNDEEEMHTRLVNLIVDAPAVQYKIDTTVVGSAAYQGFTGLNAARPGSHSVTLGSLRPTSLVSTDSSVPIDLTGSFTRDYSRDTDYTIIAYGTLANPQTIVFDVPTKKDDLADDTIEITFLNTAPNVGPVNIYITAPEGGVTSPENLGTLAVGAKSNVRSMKLTKRADVTDPNAALFTDLTVEVRDATSGNVLYTSTKLRLTEQTRYSLAVIQNAGPGPSPVQLMGLDGLSSIFTAPTDQSAVRVVNLSPDSPAIDVTRASATSTPLATNLAFRGRGDYVLVPNGDVDIIAQPSGGQSAVFLYLDELTAAPGASYTSYAVGTLASIDSFVLSDDRRKVSTQAKYRFFNAAPSQGGTDGVDIYVTIPGQALDFDSTDDKDTTDDAPQFRRGTGIIYRGVTDSATYKEGTYQVRVMATGTSRVLLDTTITLTNGSVATYALIDSEVGALELLKVDEAL